MRGGFYFERGRLKIQITIQNQQRESNSQSPSLHGATILHKLQSTTKNTPKMAPISIKTVLISESVDPRCRAILQENGIRVTEKQNMKKDELIAEIKDYDGLVVRSATKVTADVINAASNLKIIGRAGTGVDNVDVDAATKKGIIVMNTPSGNTISAAELTCALIMSLSRHVPQATMSMKAGNWDRKKFMGAELYGKVLGIVGLGRIGKEVASRMQSFGMRTIGYDPITPPEVSASWGVEQMPLEKLWPQCDYITVNAQVMASTFSQESHQLIKLGEAIGAVLQSCSASKKPFSHLQITTQGDCMKSSTGYMTSAVLVGLLDNQSGCCPNLINAVSLAKESGITVNQSHCMSDGAADGVCQVEIAASGCSYKASGSVQGGVPVLLELSGSVFRQPVSLTGNLLFFKASANPQLLSSVAGLLAAERVEIQSFSAPADRTGDLWYCVGVSSLLRDLGALKPLAKEAAQLSI
eukprot:superscaffoldBa00001567_g11116